MTMKLANHVERPEARTLICAAICVAVCLGGASAAEEEPLFRQYPYDLITLTAASGNQVLKVEMLDFPNRRVPSDPPSREKLTVHLFDEPETDYELQWFSIAKIELFEQLVLAEANELVASRRLDEAFDYFRYLMSVDPDLPDLAESMDNYLYEEAKASHRRKQYDGALAMLRELYASNPQRPGLAKAMGVTTDELAKQYLAKEDYRSARALLGNLEDCFPEHAVVVASRQKLQATAETLLGEAQTAAQAGDLDQADRLTRRLAHVWPELPGAKQFAQSMHEEHPRILVGVSVRAVDPQPGRLADFAALRSSRLLYRTLSEFVRPDSEGGQYTCPVGTMTVEELDRRMSFQLKPDVRWPTGQGTLSGSDVARRLLALADPNDPAYRADWAELFGSVEVHDVYRVEVSMRQSHVRPDALLQTKLIDYASSAGRELVTLRGPYLLDTSDETTDRYMRNPQYFAGKPTQPEILIERYFAKGAQALTALQRREIDVLDRVNPWILAAVREDPDLVVQPYMAPLVHCLIPNMSRPFPSRRTFRRALVYGINRQAILDHLTGGTELPGCQVVSGPFPPGSALEDDPISYAYDVELLPRKYDPRLAAALCGVSLHMSVAADQEKPEKVPPLVLAHPAGEIARLACQSIKRQLDMIGISVELRELASLPRRVPDDVDLLYAELAIWEPVVDARRLLGEDGPAGGCSPYMSLALRRLDRAPDWREVSQQLHNIHRIAFNDIAVIPLWQMIDHFAYHKSLRGIGPQPVTLYQNIEQWQREFVYPLEQ